MSFSQVPLYGLIRHRGPREGATRAWMAADEAVGFQEDISDHSIQEGHGQELVVGEVTFKSWQHHDGSGRPRAPADREDKLTIKSAITASESLLSTIRHATLIRVFNMTIHRWLIEQNLLAYRPLHHLPFMPVHCEAKLQWYLDRSGWNHAEWGHIVFSNKSRFQL
ncbi:HTH_Tnp_Tc3_2 domain-containing protein [Trichonephila clavipes]|nr:HTH_Tnp_Tc3_2 domain-containing protein [Trichonephila clavipes]